MADCWIRDARIVTDTGLAERDIVAVDGEIAAVGPDLDPAAGPDIPESFEDEATVVDADGMVALPGTVDVHNHMHDDELFPEGIDFGSETASAVAGGVTTVVELPTQTPVTDPEAVRAKRAACEELAHVDFGLVAGNFETDEVGVGDGGPGADDGEAGSGPTIDVDVDGIRDAGVPDFKTFTSAPYRADDRSILELMTAVGAAGGKVRVHCEAQAVMDHARARIGGTDPEVYMDSRPLRAELAAINRMGWFAEGTDCPLHVVHVSSGTGAREGARFKSRAQVPVTLETCPHYLAFSEDDVADHGPFLKVNPSLKSPAEVERLWDAVADGTVDLLASEHFPTYREGRERGWDDIWEPYAGLPGIETTLEFAVSEGVHEGRIGWPRLRELVCARPASEAGVYPRKGSLRVGTDADVVLLREESYTVTADDLAFVGGWTPYEGREWSARVDTVVGGGEVVARNHEVLADPGDGEFLHRERGG